MEGKQTPHPSTETKREFVPEKYYWKKSYTLVLAANAAYIVLFYFLMKFFT